MLLLCPSEGELVDKAFSRLHAALLLLLLRAVLSAQARREAKTGMRAANDVIA